MHPCLRYMHMDAWDFLWTITAKAMLAAEILRPGELAQTRLKAFKRADEYRLFVMIQSKLFATASFHP